ncbi:MAG: tetratricopeptide repeat protein [Calothrix sp. MO_167.B12]|nr:tetratricopeptide repeat protein [Calothrix sp. MO_167.B12]
MTGEERKELKGFLKALRGGKNWVLITSRREEAWLDCGYTLLNLGGLREEEVEELAGKILQTAGVDKGKLPQEYLELLKLLGGHPLSLRVVLPHLKTQTPLQLIEALRQGLDTFAGEEEEGRDKSLTVSLDYSFSKLSEKARKHLPFLGLFSERVNVVWLYTLSESPDNEFGQAYQGVFGENLQKDDWLAILNEATTASILEHLGSTIYKIHPALPWFLRKRLNQEVVADAQQRITELEKKLLIGYAYLADDSNEKLINNAELASFILRVEEPNLLQNLRLAEQQQRWTQAQAILQALGKVYKRLGRKPEFKALQQRALNQIGIQLKEAKAKGKDAFYFWMYLRFEEATEALLCADLEAARAIYQEILGELIGFNDSSMNDKIASGYHQLGMVAQKQRQFEQAQQYYLKALKIFEGTGDLYQAANDYHQLGMVAEEQRQFEQAQQYYLKALKIFEDAGDLYAAASDYHQLGRVAYQQRQFEQAQQYLLKALKIFEDAGDFYNAAGNYHQLGKVAYQQRQFEQAQQYYLKALKIYEDAGYLHDAASDYHQLGIVAEEKRQFEQAQQYYLKALKIFENAGNLYNAASDYHQLGNVAYQQRQFEQAQQYYLKALKIFEDAGDFYNAATVYYSLGNVAYQQRQFEQAQQYYLKALKIYENAGNLYNAASDYHQLGNVAYQQRQFEQAQQYYLKALKIYENAGDFYNAAGDYHQLGMVAYEQQQFDVAISYYQKTFGIYEQFQDWYWVSHILVQWGKVLEAQSNYPQALRIYIRGLAIAIEHLQKFIGTYIYLLARMLGFLGENEFEAIWREFTGSDCAGKVREAIWKARDGLNEEG